MPEARILAASHGDVAAIRIVGRASFKISQYLRDFGMRVIEEKSPSIIFDLGECTGMDSTILGVFAMIGLEGRGTTQITIVNADPPLRSALDVVGVSRLCRFASDPVSDMNWKTLGEAAAGAADMKDVASTVLDAHRTLMGLATDNVPKFRDVVDLLESELNGSDN